MNSRITPELQAVIDERHAKFVYDDQREKPTYVNLVEAGHPLAQAYREARAFFDGLSYAGQTSARGFSHAGMHESSMYQAPELDIFWWPKEHYSSCCAFLHPGHVQWGPYVSAVAAAGWLEDAEPELRPGRWCIWTQNDELYRALVELAKGRPDMRFTSTYNADNSLFSHKVDVTQSVMFGSEDAHDALQLHNAILALLRKYHQGYVLPEGRFTAVHAKA